MTSKDKIEKLEEFIESIISFKNEGYATVAYDKDFEEELDLQIQAFELLIRKLVRGETK